MARSEFAKSPIKSAGRLGLHGMGTSVLQMSNMGDYGGDGMLPSQEMMASQDRMECMLMHIRRG